MTDFTHFDAHGNSHMVDVSNKNITDRTAIAKGFVKMSSNTINAIKNNGMKKGDVLAVAQLAGIMGAKHTSVLIPLCHPVGLTSVKVLLHVTDAGIEISATCKTAGQTGVEMEALTAINIAALTVYDMCKAVDKDMIITDIYLTHKSGGKSGEYNKK